eukprot:3540414-Heterocapsa_arctica.AAC.1
MSCRAELESQSTTNLATMRNSPSMLWISLPSCAATLTASSSASQLLSATTGCVRAHMAMTTPP